MDRILWYSRMIFIHRGLTQDIAVSGLCEQWMKHWSKIVFCKKEGRTGPSPVLQTTILQIFQKMYTSLISINEDWNLFIYLFLHFLSLGINLDCCDGMHVLLRIIGHGAIAEVFSWLLHVNYVLVFAKFHENVVGSVYPYKLRI